MTRSRDLLRSEAALLGVVCMWGLNFTVMKVAVERVDPLVFNAARFTLSVVFLGLLHAREARRWGRRALPPRRLLPAVVGLGVVGHLGYQVGFVLGLERTTSGTASLLIASAPLWTGLVVHLARLEVLGVRAWTGLLLAIAGTAAVAAGTGLEFGPEVLSGNLLCIGAAACWGVYTAWNRPHLVEHSPLALAYWTMLAALPLLWAVALPGLARFDASTVDAAVVGAAIYAGLFGTGLAYVLWNVGVRGVGPARTATAACLVPVIALLLGAWALEEPIEPAQVAGGAVVLAGLATMGRARAASGESG